MKSRLLLATIGLLAPLLSIAQGASQTALPSALAPAEIQEANRMYRRGDLDDAMKQLAQYLAKNPKDAQARFLRGLVFIDQRKPDAAIAAFNELAQEQPELPEPHNNLAVLYAGKGDYDKARDALNSALLANPNDLIARENLGDVYVRLAQQAYERALTGNQANRPLREKLALVRGLSNGKPRPIERDNGGAPRTLQHESPAVPPFPSEQGTLR